ncbi:hypothetical protein Taro_027609 [Colocasia esculenta]|uniref:Bulb-type lectin domain-containing protein n=1 Tax=Colocasia esculenta TaxID=4460 RepID=A0A843VG59_COLES|nr:hypothetical protein [Colocasia esculenta]
MATSSSQQKPFLYLFSISAAITLAQVPSSQMFTYVHEGEEPFFCWVWDANRGRPVGENTTLTFGTNGNLVLAEADGRVVWSTNTTNKAMVGLRLLSSGNLVLHDSRGWFMWQSFDHPTDTHFADQSLCLSSLTKLMSHKSETENLEGMYSMVLEHRVLTLYMDASTKPLPYGQLLTFTSPANVTLTAEDEGNNAWSVSLMLSTSGGRSLVQPKYNTTNSILRLQIDGNLVVYTYNEQVDSEPTDRTLVYFSDNIRGVSRCELPSKCGSLGMCKDEMCVAYPTPKGLLGWSEDCSPLKLGLCKAGAANAAGYNKVVGVENFLSRFVKGEGPVKVDECKSKCGSDCNCLGFLY